MAMHHVHTCNEMGKGSYG